MTVFEYALYTYSRRLMTPDELNVAAELAKLADEHRDLDARAALKELAVEVIRRDNTQENNKNDHDRTSTPGTRRTGPKSR